MSDAPTAYKIMIVGGGPAGLSAALHIAQQAPSLVPELLVLEAAEYPRPKLCGGGVTFHGETQLQRLGVKLNVPDFVIDQVTFQLGSQAFTVGCAHAMRIIMREEFDAALAAAARARGIRIQTGERLRDVRPGDDGVDITTTRGRYQAQVLIGADGANSTVRQKLRISATKGVARLLRILTPINPQHSVAWQQRNARFDFSCVLQGVQGYIWDFPCLVEGQAHMNRGIFDSRIEPVPLDHRPHGQLKRSFTSSLENRHIDPYAVPLKGHPVRWFNPAAEFSRPHVLLAGDAAGVDPMFAEGISFALEYGEVVAAAICEAFQSGDFTFATYRTRLLQHHLGQLLKKRAFIARHLYLHERPRFWFLLWQLAAIAPAVVQRAIAHSLALLPPLKLR